jgi:hypothetical protein
MSARTISIVVFCVGLGAALLGACGSASSLAELEASCDTAAKCSNWNTSQTNACKDDFRNQVSAADLKGCKTQLDAFSSCVLTRARCEGGSYTTGGCNTESAAFNTCTGGSATTTTSPTDPPPTDTPTIAGGPGNSSCVAKCEQCGGSNCGSVCEAASAGCQACIASVPCASIGECITVCD